MVKILLAVQGGERALNSGKISHLEKLILNPEHALNQVNSS